ncbi:MAG: hypothetical protein KA146_02295 [Leptospiraceae bacterium]|nr:hypothetical protein [Leptospiraceae bacterium]
MNKETAVLIDITGIQEYIFQNKKLKENIGASYIIEHLVYKQYIKDVLKKEAEFEGGGNCLLRFPDKEQAKEFTKEWSKRLLVLTPSLVPSIAVKEDFDFDSTQFPEDYKSLNNELKKQKNSYIPVTHLLSHGINAECSHSNLSMEIYDRSDKDESEYISASVKAKLRVLSDANEMWRLDFLKNESYKFPLELDNLGSKKGEDSHIAIVHIDGNGMGERFKNCKTLKELQELSGSLVKATNKSFLSLINKIIENYKKLEKEFELKENILPIRPIVLGGDDITFVTDAKLGIYFAKLFMEHFVTEKDNNNKPLNLTACAGVAIIKNKYPFYRGYQMAEALCANAKKIRRDLGDQGSWLDYQVFPTGIYGGLKEIRESHYITGDGNHLLWRPYKLGDGIHGLDSMRKAAGELAFNPISNEQMPRSKYKELQNILGKSKEERQSFLLQEEFRDRKLPQWDNSDSLFREKSINVSSIKTVTPYYDMIEISEYYPEFLLKEEK